MPGRTDFSAAMETPASSRIFVKNLPPTITEDDFKRHFSATAPITDAKLISNRRIGYVGYKSSEEAAKAVKYFNKSFIRMSKIGVELARAISDTSLPISRKLQRESIREIAKLKRAEQVEKENVVQNIGTKRKRDNVDEADPKLKEFMEVMQPSSKSKDWPAENSDVDEAELPTNLQDIEASRGDTDSEYETVPKKSRRKSPIPAIIAMKPASIPEPADEIPSETVLETVAPNATDDDWLRSRTNRLLDLMEPEDIVTGSQNITTPGDDVVTHTGDKETKSLDLQANNEVTFQSLDEEANLDSTIEAIKSNGRLFVRNLPYTATEDDLRKHFAPFGALQEVHLPVDKSGTSKGFLLVQYENPSAAAEAFHNLDGESFQGRLLHILPATAKREKKLDDFEIAKLPLKKQNQIKKKAEASSNTFNWNSLYMDQDAVNTAIADRLGVSKSSMLDPTSADSGYKQAIAESSLIQETKAYFVRNGVDLDSFKKRERGDSAILVKNFPYGMTLEELRKLFEEFGQVLRVLMPPTGTIAIVEFAQPGHARTAFRSLAYRRIKDSVLFLEKAPKDLFANVSSNSTDVSPDRKDLPDLVADGSIPQRPSASDLLGEETNPETADTSTLFVRNLNFTTTSARLLEIFKPLDGFMSARVNTKTDPEKPGQVLSMGYGFLEFRSKSQAQAALQAMDGYVLDGHKLLIKASHKGMDAAEERKKADRAKKVDGQRTKIIIKNLPFEATKKDVRGLFGAYGQLRSVRVPRKFDNSARGFAFADFITAREAKNALEALKDTHLLGRRLVLEFASGEALDAEEEIERMQKRVGSQVNKVAMQKLTGGGRKKFNIDDVNESED